jgi:uncharacterized cupin superfamily protein
MACLRILAPLAVVAAFLVFPTGAVAQQADTAGVSTAIWTACPGAYVRVATRAGETVTGRCGPIADGRLQVRARAEDRQIQLADVDSLWTRRSYLTEATLLLAVVGAGAGALLGDETERCTGFGCAVEYQFGRAESAAIGAVAGGVLGVLIGPRITHWRQRFP